MINRYNYLAMKKYLAYRRDVEQLAEKSIRLEESWLRYALEWALDKSFEKAPTIRPAFPDYVLNSRRDGDAGQLSKAYLEKVISATKRLLSWLAVHERGYSAITPAYLDTLRLPHLIEQPSEHEHVTLEEVRAMAQADVQTGRERRTQAAAVFLFLSGIRVEAFTTLPLKAVDIQSRMVKQWPNLGVKTKGGKHATTFLLNEPDLLAVVRAWDDYLRSVMPQNGYWFAPLSPIDCSVDPSVTVVGKHRHVRLRKDLKSWLDRVGLPYHSPHKFRHGHAVYSLSLAQDVGDLKAISQNLMHANLSITDGIYAILTNTAVQERIERLGKEQNAGSEPMDKDIAAALRVLADRVEGRF